jgi:hypothetical protein
MRLLDGTQQPELGWERLSPGNGDPLQTFLLLMIVFIAFFLLLAPIFVDFAAAVDLPAVCAVALDLALAVTPRLTSTSAFASRCALMLTSFLTIGRELTTLPTRLATEPNRNTVFAKLV